MTHPTRHTTPLRIHVLFQRRADAEHTVAEQLADALYGAFASTPASRGARIPVRFAPLRDDGGPLGDVQLDAATFNVVVVLVDTKMTRRHGPDAAHARWEKAVLDVMEQCREDASSVCIPVAVDDRAFDLSDALEHTSFVRLEHLSGTKSLNHLLLHVITRALRLLNGSQDDAVDAEPPPAPVSVFVSHAKADLGSDKTLGPVNALLRAGAEAPVDAWFDAANIDAGQNFADTIAQGVVGATVLIAVVTDAWSGRPWCQYEVLAAKQNARPVVVVDALEHGCERYFPYLGNVPIVPWRAASFLSQEEHAPEAVQTWWNSRRRELEAEDVDTVITVALKEALRHRVESLRLRALASDADRVLGDPPEALTTRQDASSTARVWYPDPPLGSDELAALVGEGDADGYTTPLSELARAMPNDGSLSIALSLSGSPDAYRYGGSSAHLSALADDVVLYLLLAGMRICYGGMLNHGGLSKTPGPGDETNYVQRLFGMVRSYAPLAQAVQAGQFHPIINHVPWPIWRKYTDANYDTYGKEAVLYQVAAPSDVADHGNDQFFAPTDLEARYAWCRGLTAMREEQLAGAHTDSFSGVSARVSLGGKLAGSLSRWPGVLEEIVLTLRAGKPVYLIGTFGGASRLVADVLAGNPRDELTTEWFREHHLPTNGDVSWDALVQRYRDDGLDIGTPESLHHELRAMAANGLAAALNNGLSDDENHRLINCDDPHEAVTLILKGLSQCVPSPE